MHSPIPQEYPAEGSRDLIDRELRRQERRKPGPKAGPDDVLRILGEMSPDRIAAILALAPDLGDLELAGLWSQGNGDVTAIYGHILTGKPAAIIDIVQPDWEELDEH